MRISSILSKIRQLLWVAVGASILSVSSLTDSFSQITLLKDINLMPDAGTSGVNAFNLKEYNGELYFTGNSDVGVELLTYDGTSTSVVRDINPGSASSDPSVLTTMNGYLYFIASDGLGKGLWKSDGTTSGTSLIQYFEASGTAKSFYLIAGQTKLYICVLKSIESGSGNRRWDIWVTDGSTSGTTLLYENFIYADSVDEFVAVLGDRLFFSARNATTGGELWSTDGTVAGTAMVKDIHEDGSFYTPSDLRVYNNTLYFAAVSPTLGAELWKTDGTETGTVIVKDLTPGPGSTNISGLYSVGNTLLMVASTPVQSGLFKSDGTDAGTVYIGNTAPGTTQVVVNNTLFFTRYSYTTWNYSLWKWTEADGTSMVREMNSYAGTGPSELTSFNDKLFFIADDPNNATVPSGTEIWQSDGTEAGTVPLTNFAYREILGSSYPRSLTAVGNNLYFCADDAVNGNELWKLDGSTGAVTQLTNLTPATLDGFTNHFGTFEGAFYFAAGDEAYGIEPRKSNGTTAGTGLLIDANPGPCYYSSNPSNFVGVKDKLLFVANNTLWQSNGVGASPVSFSSSMTYGGTLVVDGNTIYFSARWLNASSYTLCKSTYPFATGEVVSQTVLNPSKITKHNGKIYFGGGDPQLGLFVSDGTSVQKLKTLAWIGEIVSSEGNLFFQADDGVNGIELWTSDGTPGGTVMLKNISPNNAYQILMKSVGGTVYFIVDDGVHGHELWKSDGTIAGTQMVSDIFQGSGGSSIDAMVAYRGKLYFSANDGIHGKELWQTDGTANGTMMISDLNIGAYASDPNNFYVFDNALYFTAYDNTIRTLWKTNGNPCGTIKVTSNSTVVCGGEYHEIIGEGTTILLDGWTRQTGWEVFKHDITTDLPIAEACKVDQIVNLDVINDKVYSSSAFAITASATSLLPVTFTTATPEIVSISGNQVTMLKSGNAKIIASQPGSSIYKGTVSERSFTISKASPIITFNEIPPKKFGDLPFALSASTTAGPAVEFSSSDNTTASISGNLVTVHRPGLVTISATQTETDRYLSAVATRELTISKAMQSMSFTVSAKTYGDAAFNLDASVSTGLPVTYSSSNTSIISVAGSMATIHRPGIVTLTASQAGDANHSAVSEERTVSVAKANQTISFNPLATISEGASGLVLNAVASSGLAVAYASENGRVEINGSTYSSKAAGKETILANQVGNDFYLPAAPVSQEFCITPGKPKIELVEADVQTSLVSSFGGAAEWYFNNVKLENETSHTLVAKDAGTYSCKANADGCLSEMSDAISLIVLGTEGSSSEVISFFPNPVKDYLTITFPSRQSRRITIVDQLGRKIKTMVSESQTTEVEMSTFVAGTYSVIVTTPKTTRVFKFIKK